MQVLAFVNRRLTDFPEAHMFESDCITTKTFYEDIHRSAETKIHLHDSRVTGEIFGFVQNFCDWKVRESK